MELELFLVVVSDFCELDHACVVFTYNLNSVSFQAQTCISVKEVLDAQKHDVGKLTVDLGLKQNVEAFIIYGFLAPHGFFI
jgi:hypothetical protein